MLNQTAFQRTSLNLTAALVTCMFAAVTGMLTVVSLHVALVPIAAVAGVTFLASGERTTSIFLFALGILLTGYAFAGRGFAYLGAAPIYVSEAVLGLAAVALLVKLGQTRFSALHFLLLLFMGWGLARTIPYIQRDGIIALRDAAVWVYALYSIAISLVMRSEHLEAATGLFAKLSPVFVIWAPILFILYEVFRAYLPLAPGSVDATIPYYNPGDIAVHLAGVAAFVLVGHYSHHRKLTSSQAAVLGLFWVVGFVMCSSISRGAFLAGFLVLGAAFLLRPSKLWLPFISAGLVALLVIALINPTFSVEGRQRNVSVGQLLRNTSSIFGNTGDEALEPTRRWRVAWWEEIIHYTVEGPYFWTGKGFGVNLADSDGFQVFADHSLRSPHNTHLTILARMGVPGFVLWVLLNAVWVAALWGARRRALASGQQYRAAFSAWLLLYWLAMTVNGAFSLYLEAPQQGIWYWSVFGLGLALLRDERPKLATSPADDEPHRPRRSERRPRLVAIPGYAIAPMPAAMPRPAAGPAARRRSRNGALKKEEIV